MWKIEEDRNGSAPDILLCHLFTMFFLSYCLFSITLWPHYARMASLCSIPAPLQNLCLPSYPDPLRIVVSTVESWSLKHCRQIPRQQLCITHVPPFASFHSSSPFITLLLFQPTLSFPLWPLPHHSEQVIPPGGPVLNPSPNSTCCFLLQLSQPPVKPVVSDNRRHLSHKPAAPTEEDASKKGLNSVKASEKKPRGTCWGRLIKSYSSNKFDSMLLSTKTALHR